MPYFNRTTAITAGAVIFVVGLIAFYMYGGGDGETTTPTQTQQQSPTGAK
jgi:hypothetical protein